jgi:hypothetical protein
MILSVANLAEAKAFTSKPVERTIKWDGHEFTCFVRPLTYQTAMGDLAAINGADPTAARIAGSICDADGKAVFTVNDITGDADAGRGGLHPDLTYALLAVIGEVQKAKKKSPLSTTLTSSGASSSSTESAAKRSRKPKPTS